MTTTELDKLRYPIGKFTRPTEFTKNSLAKYIQTISEFSDKLKKEVSSLNDEQLNTPYRPEGWTIRQVVHHLADSHLNSFTRFKLALTEDKPTIKPYVENLWAETADAKTNPIQPSLMIIEGLHLRWTILLNSLSENDLEKVFVHPEQGREMSLKVTMALYSWHCDHHLAHIVNTKKNKGWK